MVHITTDDVRRLATLSALTLADDEIDSLREDIASILSYVEQLGQLDTSGIEPTYQVTGLQNVWREDTVDPGVVSGEELVQLAPAADQTSIKVPKVL